jgi:CHAT domain-containing protein
VLVLLSEKQADKTETVTYTHSIRRRILAGHINELLQIAAMKDEARWRQAAGEIVALLPDTAFARLASASRVIVVPHDMLWRIPFEALPVGNGYLGDKSQIVYAGSADVLTRAGSVQAKADRGVLVISAPTLTADAVARIQQTAPDWPLRPAESAEREATVVLKAHPDGGRLMLAGEAATESNFATRAASAAVLHVAAPFRINGASPLFSPILLAGDTNVGGDNGSLEAREVANLVLESRVLVLSDGAAMSMREGAASAYVVQWAWLAAGVPSIVMVRWAADPGASDTLLTELHRRLASGADAATALHAARTAVRKRSKWAAPYYWAGTFVLGF